HRRRAADQEVTKGDRLIEGAADRLEETAERLAGGDGLKAKAAAELAEDAHFLRKLKPSLIAARARGAIRLGFSLRRKCASLASSAAAFAFRPSPPARRSAVSSRRSAAPSMSRSPFVTSWSAALLR